MIKQNKMSLPPEIINYIFSYSQSATNTIMKQHIKDIVSIRMNPLEMISILKLNKEYHFIHYNHNRFISYHYCTNCNEFLTIKERLKPVVVYGNIICYECIDMYPY
jgi:hypothetical protein